MQKLINIKSAITALLCLNLLACGSASESEAEMPLRPVRVLVVDQNSASSSKTFSGVSRSAQESRLSFKVGGTITEIPVKAGDRIKAGTVIARLDASTYDLQRQQAQATAAQSSAAARNAKAAYERTRNLYSNNNVSLGELESARANSETAAAQLRSAQKSLQLAELNYSYTDLKVDVDCVVDSISVAENENVASGTEVARVNCSDELEIQVSVPESIIGELAQGKEATVTFDAISDKEFKAKVTELGASANGVGSTFPVTVLVGESTAEMRTGLAASVSFITENIGGDSHLIPLSSVVRRAGDAYVYLVQPEDKSQGTIALRKVTLGELRSDGIEVRTGLQLGDHVVTAGVGFLREGMQVLY